MYVKMGLAKKSINGNYIRKLVVLVLTMILPLGQGSI